MASHEYQTTVFSPEGKLHQIEYAFKAIKSCGLTSLAIRGSDSVVFVCEKKVDDLMIDPSTVSNLYMITPQIGALATGREADGRAWVMRLRQEAFEFMKENGVPITADVLASRAADIAQLYTQKSGMRAYAVEMTLASVDRSKGPLLYQVDPAGHCIGHFGCSSGVKDQEAQNELEKMFREKGGFTDMEEDEVVRNSMLALQNTLGQDFKATDIEVAVVNKEGKYMKMTTEQVEAHLNAVQKFD